MKIRTKLYIGAALSLILISSLAFSIFQLSSEVKEELKRAELADELVSGTTELTIITGEYATYHEARMEQQWQSKFDSITEMVKKEEESPLLDEIRTDLESLNNSFSQLKANYKERDEFLRENASQEEVERTIILEERLAARMRVDSTRIWSNAFEIAKESRERTNDAQQRANSRVSIFAVFLVAVIGTTMAAVARSITKPIDELVRGAEIVGKGNLDHRIEIKSNDETGFLSQAFNDMVEKRKRADEALRESEKKFRGLSEKSLVGVYLIQDGVFKYVNPKLAEIFGYTIEELIDKKGPKDLVLPEDWPIVKENLRKRISGEVESIRYDFKGITKNKKSIYIEVHGSRTVYHKRPAVIGTLLDITERKRAEEALRKAHDELEVKVAERTKELAQANIQLKELDRLKSMFIASMSHELRTPLNSIIGFSGIILQGMTGEITEEQRKQLTMVKNSADHLLALINDIIDLSKIEADKVELTIEEFDLSGLVQEVKASFRVAAAEKGLKLSLKTPRRLVIKCDERRTKQVLVNIVNNAVKFTDIGEIEIKVAKKDGMVEVSVRDTGIGIRDEHMHMLFKAFSQVPLEGRPMQEGTGLGLYLSKKIAGLLGGKMWAESKYGKGSEFTFALPLKYQDVKT